MKAGGCYRKTKNSKKAC